MFVNKSKVQSREALHQFLLDNTFTLSFPLTQLSPFCKFLAIFIATLQKERKAVFKDSKGLKYYIIDLLSFIQWKEKVRIVNNSTFPFFDRCKKKKKQNSQIETVNKARFESNNIPALMSYKYFSWKEYVLKWS